MGPQHGTQNDMQGYFNQDLHPSFGPPGTLPSSGGGMVVGPGNPIFGAPQQGGMGMMPRFDPFGSPGGPGQIPGNPLRPNPGRGRGRGGGTGVPNNDLLQPPGFGGADMYM